MKINLNYDELNYISQKDKEKKDALDIEIDKLLDALEKLKNYWVGGDCDIFYENAFNYISRMKILPRYLETLGLFIDDSISKYRDNDSSYSRKLELEVDVIDEPNEI